MMQIIQQNELSLTPESHQANILTFLTVLVLFSLQPQQVVSHTVHFLIFFHFMLLVVPL